LDEEKFELDKERLRLDRSFAKTWAPVIVGAAIPLLVALATAIISYNQFKIAQKDSDLKGVDYYVRVLTDPSYTKLSADEQVVVVTALSKFFPDIWTRGIRKIVVSQIVAGPGSSNDPSQDARYRALSRLPETPTSEAPGESTTGTPSTQYTIYIHYKNSTDKDVIDGISQGLRQIGYLVPAAQMVTQATKGDIRYYKKGELSDAELLKQNVQKIMGADSINLSLIDISKTFPNLPSGVMEIWIPDLHQS
jgi:hypothetical protein